MFVCYYYLLAEDGKQTFFKNMKIANPHILELIRKDMPVRKVVFLQDF
jgi:hypothetical protein